MKGKKASVIDYKFVRFLVVLGQDECSIMEPWHMAAGFICLNSDKICKQNHTKT